MIKNKLLKNTNENEIHTNFRDKNNILAKLISSSYCSMPVSHMPQTIRIGPEPSRKLNIATRIDRIGWDCMMLAILQY